MIKKILLIWPKLRVDKFYFPLSYAYLLSNTNPAKYQIDIINCTLQDIDTGDAELFQEIRSRKPDLVGLTSTSLYFDEAKKIFHLVKKIDRSIITIYGGPHATCYPEKVMENKEFDFAMRGEAELVFEHFLDELNKSKPVFNNVKGLAYRDIDGLVHINEISRIENLDLINLPNYDGASLDEYRKNGYLYSTTIKNSAPVFFTRGCPYTCKFCAAPVINGRTIRKHSIDYLIKWVEYLYFDEDTRLINIIDDNFTFDIDYAKNFCRRVIALDLKDLSFASPNGIRMQRGDNELWTLMKKAGWKSVVVAPESGSENVLKLMRKRVDINRIPEIIKSMKQAGLRVHGFFIIGYPGETKGDLKKTATFIKKCKFDAISISLFQPLPGTPVYDDLVKQGIIPGDYLPTSYMNMKKEKNLGTDIKDINVAWYIMKIYMMNPFLLIKQISLNPKRYLKTGLYILREVFLPS